MNEYLRNPLTIVWSFLTAITLAAWAISRGGSDALEVNTAITVGVLIIATVKAQFVIHYFMEVRTAARWLKFTTWGWNLGLLGLLLAFYLLG